MQICPVCQQNIPDQAPFCPTCGTAFDSNPAVVALCRVCGGPLDPTTHRCPRRCEALYAGVALPKSPNRPQQTVNAYAPPVAPAYTGPAPGVTRGSPQDAAENADPAVSYADPGVTFVDAPTVRKAGKKKVRSVPAVVIALALAAAFALGIYFATHKETAPLPDATAAAATPSETAAAPQRKVFSVRNFHITLTDAYTDAIANNALLHAYSADVTVDVNLSPFGEKGWTADNTAEEFAAGMSYPDSSLVDQSVKTEYGLTYRIWRYDAPDGSFSQKTLSVFYKADDGFWLVAIAADPDYFDAHVDELKAFARTVTFD